MKKIMTGNEAIARGAWEAGLHIAAAYPGTPSTEILENIATYPEIYCEWAPNEKVAVEVGAGAAFAGARAMAAMKHVGLNVAADPFFTLAYTGISGGYVINVADDPGMFSSQNEQDSRFYASHAKVPMLEPSDSQEAYSFVKQAFELSEKFDTPVLFRVSTRICHSKSLVELGERVAQPVKEYVKNSAKYVMSPANARSRKVLLEQRLKDMQQFSETTELNRVEDNGCKVGVITSGVSYQHAREVFGDTVCYLKLGFTFPLPPELILKFAAAHDEIYIIEENEPYIENFVRQLGIDCVGREKLPFIGELTPEIIRRAFVPAACEQGGYQVEAKAAPRPPVLCPGCPHRGFFYEVARHGNKIVTSADIGCYTLGAVPPLGVNDSVLCMGASVSAGIGFKKAFEKAGDTRKVISVIGDSTFFHSGITGLIDAVVNKAAIIVNILDNRITAMTGQQENPGTGRTLMGEETVAVDLKALCLVCGVKQENIRVVDPYNLTQTREALKAGIEATEPFVIITKRPCALIKPVFKERMKMKCKVDAEKCIGCKLCLKAGCPAVMVENGKAKIDTAMCNGCEICAQICPKQAIAREDL